MYSMPSMVEKFPAKRYKDDGRRIQETNKPLQMLKKPKCGGKEECARVCTPSAGLEKATAEEDSRVGGRK
jgi:hypothetical protein